MDRGIAISQELKEILDRAIKIPKTDPSTAGTELPPTTVRANKYQGYGPLPNAAPIALDPPTIDTSALYVVSSMDPGHQNGRLWLDTSGVSEHLLKVSDGAAWSTIGSRDLATEIWTPYVTGIPAGALAAAGVGDGLEISGGNARVKLDGATLTRSAAGLKVTSSGALSGFRGCAALIILETLTRRLTTLLVRLSRRMEAAMQRWVRTFHLQLTSRLQGQMGAMPEQSQQQLITLLLQFTIRPQTHGPVFWVLLLRHQLCRVDIHIKY